MNDRIERLKAQVLAREYRQFRRDVSKSILDECSKAHLTWIQRSARLIHRLCEAQEVVIPADERIVFTLTTGKALQAPVPQRDEERITQAGKWIYSPINNICADWQMVLSQGLLGRRHVAVETQQRLANDAEAVEFCTCAIETIDAILALAARYADTARELGKSDLADILSWVPAHAPRGFQEALQALRLCHSMIWLSGHHHVGLGRFDQYMWPYLQADLEAGRLDIEEAEELLAEFFISLNKDTDLYSGVQQGDNGQSLMLGGVKRDGSDAVNELTHMVLRVSRDLSMIDPKINLRVNANTDLELLKLATELTKKGLGFPQYSNDDVVIPALVAHGYDLEDARDYSVAACWEFIIPGKGMEIANIGAVSMPAAADAGIRAGLAAGDSFAGILQRVSHDINEQLQRLVDHYSRLELSPAPYYSVLMDGCLERGVDLSHGLRYNNFGVHGACSANAADALAAVKHAVFDTQSMSAGALLSAVEDNYDGSEALQKTLTEEMPKVGNHDDKADDMLVFLFNEFATACEHYHDNGRGGIVRPGTGSAMYYVWLADPVEGQFEPAVEATADGRKAKSFFSANLAPSPGITVRGPISTLQSFSKIDFQRVMNGGPITLEFSDAVFRNDEAITKVAMFIRTFIQLGCQQLQLNTVNYETLLDAKAHPERHRNLIVRVWGWSGYFCELSPEYQDHIIARHQYSYA